MLCGIGVCDSDCPVHHLPHINKAWVPEGARWLPRVMTSSPSTRQHKTSRMPSRGHPTTSAICGKGGGCTRQICHQPPFYYPSRGGIHSSALRIRLCHCCTAPLPAAGALPVYQNLARLRAPPSGCWPPQARSPTSENQPAPLRLALECWPSQPGVHHAGVRHL